MLSQKRKRKQRKEERKEEKRTKQANNNTPPPQSRSIIMSEITELRSAQAHIRYGLSFSEPHLEFSSHGYHFMVRGVVLVAVGEHQSDISTKFLGISVLTRL